MAMIRTCGLTTDEAAALAAWHDKRRWGAREACQLAFQMRRLWNRSRTCANGCEFVETTSSRCGEDAVDSGITEVARSAAGCA